MLTDAEFEKAEAVLGAKKTKELHFAYKTLPRLAPVIEKEIRRVLMESGSSYRDETLLLRPPSSDAAFGEYVLGDVMFANGSRGTFGLREHEFIRHVGVVGTTGSGKSNALALIIRALSERGKPLIAWDWKRSLRDVQSTKWGADIQVFTVGRESVSPFYFNPLIPPPGINPATWNLQLTDIIGTAYYTGFGVQHIFKLVVDALYREYGVFEAYEKGATIDAYPTFADVLDRVLLLNLRGRKAGWQDSAERVASIVSYPELAHVVNQRKPVPLEKLYESRVVLELDALIDAHKTFFVGVMLNYIFQDFLARQGERERFKLALVVDEAHHIMNKKKGTDMSGEETGMTRNIRMFRELGVGVVYADQSPALIDNVVLGNSFCIVAMNLRHENDINAIAAATGLAHAQKRYLPQLPTGTAVVKIADRFDTPFLVRMPLCGIAKGSVTDDMLRARAQPRRKPVPLPRSEAISLRTQESKGDNLGVKTGGTADGTPGRRAERLKARMAALLNDVVQHPESNYRDRKKRLSLSKRVIDPVRAELLKGLMTQTRSRGPHGLEWRFGITDDGKRFLAEHADLLKRQTKRFGGSEHQEVIGQLAQRLTEAGYECRQEVPVAGMPGRRIDLEARRQETKDASGVSRIVRVAYEYETGSSREVMSSNLLKALNAGYDQVVSVAKNETVRAQIVRDCELAGIRDERVRVVTLADLTF